MEVGNDVSKRSDTPTLCGRSLRPYVVGHSDLMWSVTPTLCGRTPRPYVVGHPDLTWSDTPTLCGRTLRPYVVGHSDLTWSDTPSGEYPLPRARKAAFPVQGRSRSPSREGTVPRAGQSERSTDWDRSIQW